MANQVSKKITFNEPAPKNIQNAGIVRVENFNRVVEDVTTLFNSISKSITISSDGAVVTGPGTAVSQSILIPANTLSDGSYYLYVDKDVKKMERFDIVLIQSEVLQNYEATKHRFE